MVFINTYLDLFVYIISLYLPKNYYLSLIISTRFITWPLLPYEKFPLVI